MARISHYLKMAKADGGDVLRLAIANLFKATSVDAYYGAYLQVPMGKIIPWLRGTSATKSSIVMRSRVNSSASSPIYGASHLTVTRMSRGTQTWSKDSFT